MGSRSAPDHARAPRSCAWPSRWRRVVHRHCRRADRSRSGLPAPAPRSPVARGREPRPRPCLARSDRPGRSRATALALVSPPGSWSAHSSRGIIAHPRRRQGRRDAGGQAARRERGEDGGSACSGILSILGILSTMLTVTEALAPFRWGILGVARINRALVGPLASNGHQLLAVASRSLDRARHLRRGARHPPRLRQLRGTAGRPRHRCRLHPAAAFHACRVGGEGGRGEEARARREADLARWRRACARCSRRRAPTT